MNHLRIRRAFTLIELLVALILMGVAAAGLASALSGDRRLRDLAAAQTFAADRTRERLERLAAAHCVAGESGTSTSQWGTERWSAHVSQSASWLLDSLVLRRSSMSVVIQARVACPD